MPKQLVNRQGRWVIENKTQRTIVSLAFVGKTFSECVSYKIFLQLEKSHVQRNVSLHLDTCALKIDSGFNQKWKTSNMLPIFRPRNSFLVCTEIILLFRILPMRYLKSYERRWWLCVFGGKSQCKMDLISGYRLEEPENFNDSLIVGNFTGRTMNSFHVSMVWLIISLINWFEQTTLPINCSKDSHRFCWTLRLCAAYCSCY